MSCDADFQTLERLIEQLFFEHKNAVMRFVVHKMRTIYLPGRSPDDVAQVSWIAFADSLARNSYDNTLLRRGETVAQREIRLLKLLFKIVGDEIANHYRKSQQKGVRAQVNVDWTADYNTDLLEASLLYQSAESTDAAGIEQVVEDLVGWAASQDMEIAGSIVSVMKDSDSVSKLTCEELAAEVSRRLGKYVTIHQIRHARTLLRKKARSMPELEYRFG